MYFNFGELVSIVMGLIVPIIFVLVILRIVASAIGGANRHGGTVNDSYQGWFYVIQQQHVGVVERLGKFHQIVGPGFHVRVPFIDRVRDVSLMTEDEHITFDAKTEDNVTIELDVSANGTVAGARIVASCGFQELEQAAIQAVKRARFTPARRGSAAVPATARLTLTFRLKD